MARYNDSINLYAAIKTIQSEELVPTDLSKSVGTSTIDIISSTGADIVLESATTSLAGLLSATDKLELSNLRSIIGNAGADLDTFTGSVIPDDSTIKQALQSLESAIGGALSYLLVDSGSHTLNASKLVYARSDAGDVTINLSSSMESLVPYYLLVRVTAGNTVTLQPDGVVRWISGDATETTSSPITYEIANNVAFVLIRFGAIVFTLRFL